MVRSRSLLWSFNYAIQGIVYALRTQRNMRLARRRRDHRADRLPCCCVSGGFGLVAIVFAICLVLVTELVNTAIEATVDLAIEGLDPLAKIAKDVAAGAVFIASINAVVVAYLVLFEPGQARRAAGDGAGSRSAPASLTVIALGLVGLAGHRAQGRVARGLVPARRLAERTHRARGRRRDGARLHHGQRIGVRARAVHRGARRAKPGRVRDAHDCAGYPWGACSVCSMVTAVFQLFFT